MKSRKQELLSAEVNHQENNVDGPEGAPEVVFDNSVLARTEKEEAIPVPEVPRINRQSTSECTQVADDSVLPSKS